MLRGIYSGEVYTVLLRAHTRIMEMRARTRILPYHDTGMPSRPFFIDNFSRRDTKCVSSPLYYQVGKRQGQRVLSALVLTFTVVHHHFLRPLQLNLSAAPFSVAPLGFQSNEPSGRCTGAKSIVAPFGDG